MKRRQMVVVTGLVLAAFALGLRLGARMGMSRRVSVGPLVTMAPQAGLAPGASAPSSSSPCVDIRNAGPLVGKNGCVTGLVLRVSSRAGNTFLDFCSDYRACSFTSAIFASDKDKFGDLESLQGRRVEIRGDVISYQGHAEIIIRDPQQVRSAP